jgi:hypothetical protein
MIAILIILTLIIGIVTGLGDYNFKHMLNFIEDVLNYDLENKTLGVGSHEF